MDKQMNLMEFLRLCLRRWWVFLFGVAIGGVLSGMFTVFFVTPLYVSEGALYAQNSSDVVSQDTANVSLNTLMVRKELVQTYAEVLTSNAFLKRVIDESGLDYSREQLRGMISISSKNNTEILLISVESPNPQHSYIIAQVITNLAEEQISTVIEGCGVKLLDEPEYPETFSSLDIGSNIRVGMFIGFLLSLLVAFLLDLSDKKVKDAEQLTKLYQLPVLGEIPYSSVGKKSRPKLKKTT